MILELPIRPELLQVSSEELRHLTDRELLLLMNQRLLGLETRFGPIERYVEDLKAQLGLVKWGWAATLGVLALGVAARAAHLI